MAIDPNKIEDWQARFLDGKGYAVACLNPSSRRLEPIGMELLHITLGTYDVWMAEKIAETKYAVARKMEIDNAYKLWEAAGKPQGKEPKLEPVFDAEIKKLELALESHRENRRGMVGLLTVGQLLQYNSQNGSPILPIPQSISNELNQKSGVKYSDLVSSSPKLAAALDEVDYFKIQGILHSNAVRMSAESGLLALANSP